MEKILFLFGLLSLVSCSSSDLPQYTKLGDLRILAITVSTPEIQNPSAGTTNVTIDPYISDINGSGSVTLEVQSCLDPGVSLGQQPSCTSAQYASSVQTVTVTAPVGQAAGTFGSPERTGKSSSGSITVGLQIPSGLLSGYSTVKQFNGIAYLITVKAIGASSTVSSFKRVIMTTRSANSNPTLTDLYANGVSISALPSGSAELSFATSSSPETYQYMSSDGSTQTLTESFEVSWFISDGEVLNPRTLSTETTTWSAPTSSPSGRQSVVVGVMRDGRGGTSVLVKKF